MGEIRKEPPRGKLFFGLLGVSDEMLELARRRLAVDFSPVDCASAVIPFTHTNYYQREIGQALLRQWIAMSGTILLAELPDFKLHTNSLEKLFAEGGGRRVNIDPGYITLSKVVLATTKDYDHRICTGNGIFEEVTLHYRRSAGGFVPWPWTYPDYATETARAFFLAARALLHDCLKHDTQKGECHEF
ncbi:MAG: DUF4416 family protein [bacterium]|nr:DUF4416 family protein [Candidatus Sumerlaeota bacterium]